MTSKESYEKIVLSLVKELNAMMDSPVKRNDYAKRVKAYWQMLEAIYGTKWLYETGFDFSLS